MLQYFPNITGSLQVTGSVSVSGSITATGGIIVSGSIASASFATTSSFASTASSADNFVVRQNVTASNMLSTGTITAQTLVVQTVTSSILYSSGSNIFGNQLTNTQQFTGSFRLTGSNALFNVGCVGISTTNLKEALNIGNGGAIGFQNTGSCGKWHVFYSGIADGLNFVESGVEDYRLFLKAGGNVGIGTSTMNYAKFNVYNNINDSTYNVKIQGVFGNCDYLDSDAANGFGAGASETQFLNGTSNRPAILSLGGSLNTNEAMGAINFFRSGNSDNYKTRATIAGVVQSTGTANQHGGFLSFRTANDGETNPSERLRISSAGKTYIGTSMFCWTDSTFKTLQVGNGAFNNINNQTQIVNNIYYDDVSYKNLIAGAANRIIMTTNGDIQFEYGCAATAGSSLTLAPKLFVCGIDGSTIICSTAWLKIPVGTSAQRPASPQTGMIRMNSSIGQPEWYDSVSSAWVSFASQTGTCTYDVQYLIVGGGGGAGGDRAGGGGGGGYRLACTTVTSGTSYYAIVGAGGANNVYGVQGGRSSFNQIVSLGGGAGGDGSGTYPGTDGGSGGGGGNSSPGNVSGAPGLGTTGQGNNGGCGVYAAPNYGAGGGGGAGAVGANGTSTVSGNGGDGCSNTICGVSRFYAGGGGAGNYGGGTSGTGGQGGGGNGTWNTTAGSGAVNSGGGGGSVGTGGTGGTGGSGIVIIRYCGSQRGTGGTVVSCNGHTIHIFTSSTMYLA